VQASCNAPLPEKLLQLHGCDTDGSQGCAAEASSLLGCYAVLTDKYLLMFRGIVVTFAILTLVIIYHLTQHNP
jgi:hypothetical protein